MLPSVSKQMDVIFTSLCFFYFFIYLIFCPDAVSATWKLNTSQQASTTSSPPPSCPNRKDPSSWTLPAPHRSKSLSCSEDGAGKRIWRETCKDIDYHWVFLKGLNKTQRHQNVILLSLKPSLR